MRALLGAPASSVPLVGTAEEGEGRPEQDQQVGLPVVVADVPEVELDPLGPRQLRAAMDLRPTGDPGLHVEAVQLLVVVLVDLVAEGRSRPDDRHVAADDVPELRQLVDAQPTKDPACLRDPRVAPVDRVPRALLFGADDHCTKLQQLEVGAVLADADLLVEHGASVLELHRNRAERQQRGRDDEPEAGNGDVEHAVHARDRSVQLRRACLEPRNLEPDRLASRGLRLKALIQARLDVVGVLVAFIVAWAVLMTRGAGPDASDVVLYHTYGEALRHGHVPYRDFAFEYPPGALVAFGLPALVGAGLHAYRIAFEVLMGACGVGVIVASAFSLARLRERALGPTGFIAAGTVALGPIALGHFDLLPAFLLSAGLAALLWDKRLLSAVFLGLAIATKLYALVLVPIAVIWVWRTFGRRSSLVWLGAVIATIAACFLPFVIAAPGAVFSSVNGQASRPLQVESSGGALLMAAHQLFSLPIGIVFSHSSANLGGASATAVATASVVAELLLLLFVWHRFARMPLDRRLLVRSATAAVLTFVVLGKVFSPQFLLWLIPLVPLVGGTLATAGSALLALALVLTRAYFPGRWVEVLRLESLPTWFLVGRDLVLLGLLAAVVAALATQSASPESPGRAHRR
jgi:hypothetical protein